MGEPEPEPPDPCADRTKTGKIECIIKQPVVTAHETEYPKVVFAPGDIVDVVADGCVQTGGFGQTWKRYVNPSGDNSDRLYHGMIRIPTGTKDSALVRIRTLIGRQLLVSGTGVPESQLFLRLGYEDDDYSDNGYYGHDNGTGNQCLTDSARGIDGGPAHVKVTIYRKVEPDPPSSRFDFNVFPNNPPKAPILDPNGLLFNPRWSWQLRPGNEGEIPKTSLCHDFRRRVGDVWVPSFSDCTDQADESTLDLASGINGLLCSAVSDIFPGHVNWFPVTMEGNGGWGDHGRDDDYTFGFMHDEPKNGEDCHTRINPLSTNGRCGLHVEFDSDETIDHFTTKGWKDLRVAVDAWSDAKAAVDHCLARNPPCSPSELKALIHLRDVRIGAVRTFFNGHMILTGMYGLDGEHVLKAELHPLYAMANRRHNFQNGPDDEAWLMFVRNQGNEGFCSSFIWEAGFQDYTFRLPWREGMEGVEVNWDKTKFNGTDGTSGPFVQQILPGPGSPGAVFVTFHLGPPVHESSIFGTPASEPFIEGTLHLIWKPPIAQLAPVSKNSSAPGVSPRLSQQVEADRDAEGSIEAAVRRLPLQQQRRIRRARRLKGTAPVVTHLLPSTGPVQVLTEWPAATRSGGFHAIKAGPAIQKTARDEAMIRALCAATRNAPKGLPASLCKSIPRNQR